MIGSKNQNVKYGIVSTVELGDMAAVLLMVAAMHPYGTAWNSLASGQITILRLFAALLCLAIVLFKSSNHRRDAVEILAAAYAALIIVQGLMSSGGQAGSVAQGLLVFLVFAVPSYFIDKYGVAALIQLLFALFGVSVVVMDLFAFATGGKGFLVVEDAYTYSSNYYFGNKFVLSYANMFLLALGGYKFKSGIRTALLAVVAFSACAISECSTGVIGIVVMCLFIFWPFKRKVGCGWLVPVLIVAMALIAVVGTYIMELPAVQSFTVGVLGETPDFSGRLPIYSQIPGWFFESPIFGYGSSAAANAVVRLNNGAADCQVGLFQILLSNGLIGGLLFLSICFASLAGVSETRANAWGIYSYLIAMALASLVEINLGPFFLLGLSLMSNVLRPPVCDWDIGSECAVKHKKIKYRSQRI